MRTLPQQLLHDKDNGLSESQIAEKHNLATSEVRTMLQAARGERRVELIARVNTLSDRGYSNAAISDALHLTESEVRLILGN